MVAGLAMLTLLVGVVVIDDDPRRDPAPTSAPASAETPRPSRVLFIGDSIGDQFSAVTSAELAEEGYDTQVWAVWGKGLLDHDLRDGTFFASLVADFDPDVVVLENVGNYNPQPGDAAADSDAMYDEWARVVTQDVAILSGRGAAVVVVRGPASAAEPLASRTPRINALYDQLEGVVLADGWAALGGDQFRADLHWDDGVHLTDAGAVALSDAVRQVLDGVLDLPG